MVSSQSVARALDGFGENVLLGLDNDDKTFKEIKYVDSQGNEVPVVDIRKIGSDYLFLDFGQITYIANIKLNKYVELKDFRAFKDNNYIYQTDKGIYILVANDNDSEIRRIDFDSQKITPLTNTDIDKNISCFYASKSGHFITRQWIDECFVFKFFPENGNAPLRTNLDISDYSMFVIGSSQVDFLFSPVNGIKYILTNEGIREEKVIGYVPYDSNSQLYKIYVTAMSQRTNPDRIYSVSTGIMGIICDGKLRVSEIKNGNVVFNEYLIPFDSNSIYRSLLKGDYLIYDLKNDSEIKYWNFNTGESGTIYKGLYGSWNSSGNGIFYTKYKTATEFETVYYDIETKKGEVISNNGVEVIDAIWYEY